eukprot:CAMPEP_0113820318 /NCGR_PEP_ID=MMETSP0328-20130328/1180_1 /TAXON_ID=39455 /ORGANISM="Alexandrium minutum" /LENGTH=513 /DNA_ID=CAMNT_0000788253 /DNA_START=214 /DNA_END=1753 /DNA_ORIENTATION=- /assembly_acc=CAM_ASM_000350
MTPHTSSPQSPEVIAQGFKLKAWPEEWGACSCAGLKRSKVTCEVAEKRWLAHNPEASGDQDLAMLEEMSDDFGKVVEVALRVNSARKGQAYQVLSSGSHLKSTRFVRMPEHHCPDFTRSDASFAVESHGKGLSRKLRWRNVWQERAGVKVDRMSPPWPEHRHVLSVQFLEEVAGGTHAIGEVALVEDLLYSNGQCFQIPTGQPSIRRKAFGQDLDVLNLLRNRSQPMAQRKESAYVSEGVLLHGHERPVEEPEHLPGDLPAGLAALSLLALLDEPGVLREAGAVDEERHAELVRQPPQRPHVLHAHRLSASRVVGHGEDDQRHPPLGRPQELPQLLDVDVPLEGVLRPYVVALWAREVHGEARSELDVGVRGVEVGVAGHDVPLLDHHREEQPLGGAPLVGREEVLEAGDLLHGLLEAVPGAGLRVGLVAPHHRRPLILGHGAGAAVCHEVDGDLVAADLEEVEVGIPQSCLSVLSGKDGKASTILMRNGSMIVLGTKAGSLRAGAPSTSSAE